MSGDSVGLSLGGGDSTTGDPPASVGVSVATTGDSVGASVGAVDGGSVGGASVGVGLEAGDFCGAGFLTGTTNTPPVAPVPRGITTIWVRAGEITASTSCDGWIPVIGAVSNDGSTRHSATVIGQTSLRRPVLIWRAPSASTLSMATLPVLNAIGVGPGLPPGATGWPLSSPEPTMIATAASPASGARVIAGRPNSRRGARRREPPSVSIAAAVRAHRSRGGSKAACARRPRSRSWSAS